MPLYYHLSNKKTSLPSDCIRANALLDPRQHKAGSPSHPSQNKANRKKYTIARLLYFFLGWAMGLLFSYASIRVSARIRKAWVCGRLPQAAVLTLRAPAHSPNRKSFTIQKMMKLFLGWAMGLEPTTTGTTNQCSTIELRPPETFFTLTAFQ